MGVQKLDRELFSVSGLVLFGTGPKKEDRLTECAMAQLGTCVMPEWAGCLPG